MRMTKDLNRNITSIQYNCLNLPSKVTFKDGSTITYLYAADGTKLRTVHKIGSTTTTTDYCGNVVYENGTQKLLLTEEGYVTLADTKYHYYLKDHQGNNRVVISQSGTVEETNHYYPFGGVFAATNNVQPYKYNGKEFDSKNGLNWYDYGARHYDAALGRFVSVDPLSEQDYAVSPYTYCGNNPVLRIDKDGRIWDTVWDIGNMLYDAGAAVAAHIRGDHVSAQSYWVDFGMDAAAVAIPFVPAGATKVLKAADKGVDAVKAAKQVDKAKDKTLRIEISPENKIDRSLLNPPSKSGNAPTFKKDGTSVEIHHVGQNSNGPFKEMSKQDHRGIGNFKKNHPNLGQPSQIDRKEFEKAKKEYWVKQEMDEVIVELQKFTPQVLDWRQPVNSVLIERFESRFNVKLPEDYKYLLNVTNGFSLMGDVVLGMTDEQYGEDLFSVYQFEHFEVVVPQYKHLIPFSPDGGGNFYCFDTHVKTNGGDSNQIVFWYSNYEYSESDPPEVTHQSLADYIKNWIIALTLEDYGYNGDRRM